MADPRSIHEFLTGEVEATTLLLGDFVDLDAQSGYTTYKMSVSDLGEVILEDIEYTQDLQTTDKTIIGAINEQQSVIGYSYDAYDPTTAYSKDDLCIYNNVLYKALQATTGNLPTNTTYWEETSIAEEIGRIDSALSGKADTSSLALVATTGNFSDLNGLPNLPKYINTRVDTPDSNGIITLPFSTLNITTRPPVILVTASSFNGTILYDYDSSTSSVKLVCTELNGTKHTSMTRYSLIVYS